MDLKSFIDGLKINYESMSESDRRKMFVIAIGVFVLVLLIVIKVAVGSEASSGEVAEDVLGKKVSLKSGPDTNWLDKAISSNSASQRRELKKEIDDIRVQISSAQEKSGTDVDEIKAILKSLKEASDRLAIDIAKEGSQRRAVDKMLAQQIDSGVSSGNSAISGLSVNRDLAVVNGIDGNSALPAPVNGISAVNKLNPFDMLSIVGLAGVSPSSLGRNATTPNTVSVKTTQTAANAESNSIDKNGNATQTDTDGSQSNSVPAKSKRTLVKIPSGSLITARLVTGLNAVVANTADSDKMFVVAKLTDPILMPNRKRVSLRGCVIMGGAKGDLSTERVYINSTVISCISSDDVLYEGTVQSNAVGEDGVVGLRGRPVTKDGALILQSSAVGLLQGFAQAFSESSNRPQIVTGSEGDYQLPSLDYVAKSSAASGIDKGLDQLLKRANGILDQIFPVLEIDAGRKVEFVVQNVFEIKEI
jgi:conjugal transfer pilus assembly protein TraB